MICHPIMQVEHIAEFSHIYLYKNCILQRYSVSRVTQHRDIEQKKRNGQLCADTILEINPKRFDVNSNKLNDRKPTLNSGLLTVDPYQIYVLPYLHV